ncbi:MAG: DNA polymerase III subunit gamma/tau [Legionella sp.]|nr:DNA polymerase III subunit gamma/tau [Legionella sp.]
MSYLALARKWRPRTFAQLVGQEHINKALIKSLNQQRLHHAYLFTGTRGVGKTSVARLMAKALNCEQGVSATPCLQCDACIAIEQGRFIDLIEIDGASKTRVEDTRDILENVQYAPTAGRYKIYLIDEVHMLSQHSFNALLKTLEEPPEHVKFLLATTDPQKIPVTVLSRCLQFSLKHLPADIIANHLKLILNEEEYPFEDDVLPLLAKAAHGSMRDALSLLDQAIASAENSLKTHEVKTILGYTHQDYAVQLLHALTAFNAPELIKLSRQIASEGGHFTYVLNELLDYLHQITVHQSIADSNSPLDFSNDVKLLAKTIKPQDVQLFYQIAIKGLEEIHLAPTMLIGFEMTVLRMFTFRPALSVQTPSLAHEAIEFLPEPAQEPQTGSSVLADEINCPPPDFTASSSSNLSAPDDFSEGSGTPLPEPATELPHFSKEVTTSPVDESWDAILKQIKLTGLAQNAAENAELVSKSGHTIVLRVATGHQSLFTPNITQRIEQALAAYYQETIKISLDCCNEAIQTTPAKKKSIARDINHQEAEESLQQDPFLQQLKQEFSAELVKNSIESLSDQL